MWVRVRVRVSVSFSFSVTLLRIAYCSACVLGVLVLSGHFGTKTLRHQDSLALNYSAAEVSGHFGTGAEVSDGHFGISAEVYRHFGTDLYETLWHHCIGPIMIVMHFVLYDVAR